MTHRISCCLAILALVAVHARADIRDNASVRMLSLSTDAPTISLPREGWLLQAERLRKDKSAVYYMLGNEQERVYFSVYINSQPPSADLDALLAASMTNESYKRAKEVERCDLSLFHANFFKTESPLNASQSQAHIQASALVGGHWFDVHLSKTASGSGDKEALLKVLRSIVVAEKP